MKLVHKVCSTCSHSKKCFLFSHSVTSQTEGLKDNSVRIGPIDTIYETNSTKGKSFTQNCFPMIVNTKLIQYITKIFDEGINYVQLPGVCIKQEKYRGQESKKLHGKAKVATTAQCCASTRCKAKIYKQNISD